MYRETCSLREKPFYLGDEDIRWVEETFASLNTHEKVGQLFCPMGAFLDEKLIRRILEEVKPGGMMYRSRPKKEIHKAYKDLQESSKIPLLIPANLESGGDGVSPDGTIFSSQMGVAATDNPEMAYRLGLVCGREARAVGCNWAFAPIVDIDMNFFNPITNVRTYGSDKDRVIRMAKEYIRGVRESGLAASIKHWPGDGVDDRDQHLVMTKNTLSVDEWERTYGMVYRELIDTGVRTVMCGHIAFPAYMKKIRPGIEIEDILPATLTPELNFKLLREELGFNGLIVSDATPMLGLTSKARRKEIVPRVVASGCDIFLFNKDIFEDYEFMLQGVEEGIITEERLTEAVMRILALKASLKLHEQQKEGTLVPGEETLEIVGSKEHEDWSRECADESITLVKDTQELLPISPEKHKKILLIGLGRFKEMFFGKETRPVTEKLVEMLKERGFEVTVFDTEKMGFDLYLSSVKKFRECYDLACYFAVIPPYSNAGSLRISWVPPLGFDTPWFIHERPTMFISCANPYHLYDVPDIKTYINAYTYSTIVLEELLDKIMGKKPFKGKSPVDPFCGLEEARL